MSKYLVFDMGGVLMDHDYPAITENFHKLLGEKHDLAFGAEGQKLIDQLENGEINGERFVDYIKGFCVTGTTSQDIIDAWNSFHAGIPERRLEMLNELKKAGYTLYLLSNNNDIHWKDVCDHYDLSGIFEQEFLSFRVHCSKPDEKIFRLVMEKTGHDASELVFIDDLEENRIAAEKLGWTSYPSIETIYSDIFNNPDF